MNINSIGIYTQHGKSAGTGKIGNVPLPNYNSINFSTKAAPAMSEEKYKEAIIAQAKKDYATGKQAGQSSETMRLLNSFTAPVSPDRKSIITQGLNSIFKNGGIADTGSVKINTLLDYLLGTAEYRKTKQEVSFAEFYDNNGELVAKYSNVGWSCVMTKAEATRTQEFYGIYMGAINDAMKEGAGSGGVAYTDNNESSFDMRV